MDTYFGRGGLQGARLGPFHWAHKAYTDFINAIANASLLRMWSCYSVATTDLS